MRTELGTYRIEMNPVCGYKKTMLTFWAYKRGWCGFTFGDPVLLKMESVDETDAEQIAAEWLKHADEYLKEYLKRPSGIRG